MPDAPPPLRLAVVSDTHGHVGYCLDAVRMLEALDVQAVIHCGDIGSVDIVSLFKQWPTHFVFGNCDYDRDTLREAIAAAGQTCHEALGTLQIEGRRVAFLHSDDAATFAHACRSGEYDLVCYGHTHEARQQLVGRTLVLNPGALYRANPHSIALVDFPSLKVTEIAL